MIILAIETSCDETSVAIVEGKGGLTNPSFKILSNIVLSQIKIHKKWGGVVPSLAKREHQINLIPILKKALIKAELLKPTYDVGFENRHRKSVLAILNREPELLEQFLKFIPTIETPKIDAIAVTVGPGLEPALWVGINFARALTMVWKKPVVAVNHMEGHIAAILQQNSGISKQILKHKTQTSKQVQFPALALLVSGGHTELVFIKKWLDYKIIGETRDDAAGEAFDKTARMLELPYPGGPEIAKMAINLKSKISNLKSPTNSKFDIHLPRPMIDSKDYDFSFSGLKTAVLYMLRDMKERQVNIGDFTPMICNEIQQAIVDVLIAKTIRAAKEYGIKSIILGGGVAANKELRAQMKKAVARKLAKTTALYLPPTKLTTDNAAMIGAAGYLHASKKDFTRAKDLKASGNLKL